MIIYTVCNDNQWTVGCIFDSTKLGTNEYQQQLMSALLKGRQHWSEKYFSDTGTQNEVRYSFIEF